MLEIIDTTYSGSFKGNSLLAKLLGMNEHQFSFVSSSFQDRMKNILFSNKLLINFLINIHYNEISSLYCIDPYITK